MVKGYAQEAGLDFDKTFAPAIRIESVRAILAFAAADDLFILHVDCTNAFLNGRSDWELYVHQPEGFLDPIYPNIVLRLNKALYGLKQAPRIWYLLLCGVIVGLGFVVLETDTSIYVRGKLSLKCTSTISRFSDQARNHAMKFTTNYANTSKSKTRDLSKVFSASIYLVTGKNTQSQSTNPDISIGYSLASTWSMPRLQIRLSNLAVNC